MQPRDEKPEDEPKLGLGTGVFCGGLLAMLVSAAEVRRSCSAGVVMMRRRRAACALPREARPSS